jgi:hypothetical protein
MGREAKIDVTAPTIGEQLGLGDYTGPGPRLSEAELMKGYRGSERRRSIPHGSRERPVRAIHDESGLLYGEPVSRGRTDRPEGET